MIRQEIKVEDFKRISKENEYFLWNFVNYENDGQITIRPIFRNDTFKNPNDLKSILENIDIPYFESDIKESVDFLINLDNQFIDSVYHSHNKQWLPVLLGFNRSRLVNTTFKPKCYCSSGIIEIIGELNIEFLLNSRF